MPAYEYPKIIPVVFHLLLCLFCVLDMTTKRCWLAHSLFLCFMEEDPLVAHCFCVFHMGLVPSDDCVFFSLYE